MTLALTLFIAGILTILLPCILPLIPIVLGVSIAGQSKLRPLFTILGMLVSFVGFTFLLLVVLEQFVEFADILRIGTYYVLLLFGIGFVTSSRWINIVVAMLGSLFFWEKGVPTVLGALVFGIVAVEIGGVVARRIQQFGTDVQGKVRNELGADAPWTAFIMGLTLGLVWVPCAGPALGFAFTLVREMPGIKALLLLLCYGLGTAIPLLLIGYGGQAAVHSVRALSRYSGYVKQISGVLLILTAVAFQFKLFTAAQTWLVQNTSFGSLGTDLEEKLFDDDMFEVFDEPEDGSVKDTMDLPRITRAPEFKGLGTWHNSEPLTLAGLKGKVVLIDFWTYSCINCIRTLPYIQGYWEKFSETDNFVLIGVHTPEFIFEKSEKNVSDAIARHGLTYPVVQDNDFGTWRAFANRYWPAKYLIDAEGYIRYTHFGEGAYEETDEAIESLLKEIGVEMNDSEVTEDSEDSEEGSRRSRSPETYLGERSWPALGNAKGEPTDDVVSYTAPETMILHRYYLSGDWQLADGERQVLTSAAGEIHMKFLGNEINLVLGLADPSKPVTADVFIDGAMHKTITIDRYDLFNLYMGEYGDHEMILKIKGTGVEGYAFTFGA